MIISGLIKNQNKRTFFLDYTIKKCFPIFDLSINITMIYMIRKGTDKRNLSEIQYYFFIYTMKIHPFRIKGWISVF